MIRILSLISLSNFSVFSSFSSGKGFHCEKYRNYTSFPGVEIGKAQFPHSFGQIVQNSVETVPFHNISTPAN